MSSTTKITYSINPPAEVNAGELAKAKTIEVAPKSSAEGGQQQYYAALHDAVREAKDKLGDDLTAWRDAIGKAELTKETPKTLKYDAEEDEDEEEA